MGKDTHNYPRILMILQYFNISITYLSCKQTYLLVATIFLLESLQLSAAFWYIEIFGLTLTKIYSNLKINIKLYVYIFIFKHPHSKKNIEITLISTLPPYVHGLNRLSQFSSHNCSSRHFVISTTKIKHVFWWKNILWKALNKVCSADSENAKRECTCFSIDDWSTASIFFEFADFSS